MNRFAPFLSSDAAFKKVVEALIPTISPRPDCWYELVGWLIAEGFHFDHSHAEWRKVPCNRNAIVGRISFTETEAWLTHRNDSGVGGNETSHHVKEGK